MGDPNQPRMTALRFPLVQGVYRSHQRLILLLALLWLASVPYLEINAYSATRSTFDLTMPLDTLIPFRPRWDYTYGALYLMWLVPFTSIRDPELLDRTGRAYLLLYLTSYATFLLFPVHIARPTVSPDSFHEWGMAALAGVDGPYNGFPSIHVSMALLVAAIGGKTSRALGWVLWPLAVGVAISTILLKQHVIADVVGGIVVAIAAIRAFIAPYERNEETALPVRFWLVTPIAFVVLLAGFYVRFRMRGA